MVSDYCVCPFSYVLVCVESLRFCNGTRMDGQMVGGHFQVVGPDLSMLVHALTIVH